MLSHRLDMDETGLEQAFIHAEAAYIEHLYQHHEATQRLAVTKRSDDEIRRRARVHGIINPESNEHFFYEDMGSNKETRDLAWEELYTRTHQAHYQALFEHEKAERDARFALRKAELEWDGLRYRLRLLEANAGIIKYRRGI